MLCHLKGPGYFWGLGKVHFRNSVTRVNPYSLNKGEDSSILGSNEIFGGEWNYFLTHQPKGARMNSHLGSWFLMGIPTIPKRFQGLNIKCVQNTACYRFCEECHPLKCGLLQLLLQGYRAGINHAQRRDRLEIILIILLVFALAWAIASYLGSKEKDAVAMRSKHVPRDPLVETLVAMKRDLWSVNKVRRFTNRFCHYAAPQCRPLSPWKRGFWSIKSVKLITHLCQSFGLESHPM